jgi:SAM-dependent methyltransferase
VETRKREEMEFHNRLRDPELGTSERSYLTSNKKFYSIAARSQDYYVSRLLELSKGRRVLDYGCGDGRYSLAMAEHGAQVLGIDISDVSVSNCRREAASRSLEARAAFQVMDCERLDLPDGEFDLVCEAGVLHHLDYPAALNEMARVVKPTGRVICYEAVGHNPLFQAYRRATPHLRTQYETEHILKVKDLQLTEKLFGRIDIRFFHLFSLLAVPLRNTPVFGTACAAFDWIDDKILRLPLIQRQAWMMIFELSEPRKARVP